MSITIPGYTGEVLTFGFIGMSLGSSNAQNLFDKLVGCDCRTLKMCLHYGRWYECVLNVPGGGRVERVLDYKVDVKGTVVPQEIWRPQQQGDVHRHCVASELLWPIFFPRRDGIVGVDLSLAADISRNLLYSPDSEAPLGGLATTHLCLKWPGYPEYKKQVEIRDSQRRPIKMSKLVERIAKFVARWFEDASRMPIDRKYNYSQWRVGPGGLTQDHIYIVGLVHVSAGTWQPILQLKCLVMPS